MSQRIRVIDTCLVWSNCNLMGCEGVLITPIKYPDDAMDQAKVRLDNFGHDHFLFASEFEIIE